MSTIDSQINTIDLWNNIHRCSTWSSDVPFPSDNAQAFVRHHLLSGRDFPEISILDLGCGSGATALYFATKGFKVAALDASSAALSKARESAEAVGVTISFKEGNFKALPYLDGSFDAVFSEGVLYYGSRTDFEVGVSEIFRVLKSGGLARISTKTNRDRWVTEGAPLGDSVYKALGNTWEQNLPIFCASIDQIENAFKMFDDVQIGIREFNFVSMKDVHSFWVITCRRP